MKIWFIICAEYNMRLHSTNFILYATPTDGVAASFLVCHKPASKRSLGGQRIRLFRNISAYITSVRTIFGPIKSVASLLVPQCAVLS